MKGRGKCPPMTEKPAAGDPAEAEAGAGVDAIEAEDGDGDRGEAAGAESGDVEPVELLVKMAERGEIEPWDIDIVSVTDVYLAHLDAGDLRTSGRALFYASVLLRMKSDGVVEADGAEEVEPDPFDAWNDPSGTPADGAVPDPVDSLEREMDRRLDRKQARGTPETLDELVHELRDAERKRMWKPSRAYDTTDSPRGFQRGTQTLDYRSDDDPRIEEEPSVTDVTGTAHAEDIEGIVSEVERTLYNRYDAGREEVLYAEIERAGGSRVQTFLGLLFLSHRGQVVLRQDDLFGDLWVRQPATATDPEEALAD
jgi:segregation and condensation protein A